MHSDLDSAGLRGSVQFHEYLHTHTHYTPVHTDTRTHTQTHVVRCSPFIIFTTRVTRQERVRRIEKKATVPANIQNNHKKKGTELLQIRVSDRLLSLLFHTPCRNPQLAARTETRLNVSCRVSVLTADVPGQTFQPTSSPDGMDARSKYCGRLYTQKYLYFTSEAYLYFISNRFVSTCRGTLRSQSCLPSKSDNLTLVT